MIKWLILALLLVAVSAYASSNVFSRTDEPALCSNCHAAEYRSYLAPINSSDMPVHKEKGISCIECHSPPGIQSELAARKLLVDLQLINYSLPAINRLFQANFTLKQSSNSTNFSIFKANCIKCHDTGKIKWISFNHSNTSRCEYCHILHREYDKSLKPEVSFWKRMGTGGHKNLTCAICHGTDPSRIEFPQCTKCHTPHLKGAQWDRSICLGCHNNPHYPVRNAAFSGNLTKEACGACHTNEYNNLTAYNSKHNNLPLCTNCHPKHRVASLCKDCHSHGSSHPGSSCNSCHYYVERCNDCHTNPHAPLKGLPSGSVGWEGLAEQKGKEAKAKR